MEEMRTINLDKTLETELVRQSDAFLKLITPIDYTRTDFMVTSKTAPINKKMLSLNRHTKGKYISNETR